MSTVAINNQEFRKGVDQASRKGVHGNKLTKKLKESTKMNSQSDDEFIEIKSQRN